MSDARIEDIDHIFDLVDNGKMIFPADLKPLSEKQKKNMDKYLIKCNYIRLKNGYVKRQGD